MKNAILIEISGGIVNKTTSTDSNQVIFVLDHDDLEKLNYQGLEKYSCHSAYPDEIVRSEDAINGIIDFIVNDYKMNKIHDELLRKLHKIDWDLFHKQKELLVKLAVQFSNNSDSGRLEGILNMIDMIQDFSSDVLGIEKAHLKDCEYKNETNK